jgi:hypothetical protein
MTFGRFKCSPPEDTGDFIQFPLVSWYKNLFARGTLMIAMSFFDVPVYRLSQTAYDRECKAYIYNAVYPRCLRNSAAIPKQAKISAHQKQFLHRHFEEIYGCWLFNEIIGYLRLHFVGTQVRGEYFEVNKKRIVRTRTRVFRWQTWKLATEEDIPWPPTNKGIYRAVSKYLRRCKIELPRRFIDTEVFDLLAKHINWRKLFLATTR